VGHLATYSSVSEAVSQLDQELAHLEQSLQDRKADRITHIHTVQQNIVKVSAASSAWIPRCSS